MSLAIHVSMNESSLAPFRSAWLDAVAGVSAADGAELVKAASRHFAEAGTRSQPPFLRPHLEHIGDLIRLLGDPDWQLPEPTRRALQGALAYFVDEKDLIPDDNAGFGLLDDAIVVELALTEHEHEWLAWREFDRFRRDYPECGPLDREGWLTLRRSELDAALRHRRRVQLAERRRLAPRAEAPRFRVN